MNVGVLSGYGVVVTRPAPYANELSAAIEAAGGEAIEFPVLDIEPRAAGAISDEFRAMQAPDVLIFVSRNAVTFGQHVCEETQAKIAAIGPVTASQLARSGLQVNIQAGQGYDSESLLAQPEFAEPAGLNVIIIRGDGGRELLANELHTRGANVQYLTVYARKRHVPSLAETSALESACQEGRIDCVVLLSVESLQSWLELVPDSCSGILAGSLLVTPSRRVLQTATELVPGMPTLRISGPTTADIVNELGAYRRSGKNS